MEYDRSGRLHSFHLVVHIFVWSRTLFLHLVGTLVLCAAPEAVVVFCTQVSQNTVEAFHGLIVVHGDQVSSNVRNREQHMTHKESGGKLTLSCRNCVASSIDRGGKGTPSSAPESAFFGRSSPSSSSSGRSASARICTRSCSSTERCPPLPSPPLSTASTRPAGNASGLVGSSQSTLNCVKREFQPKEL